MRLGILSLMALSALSGCSPYAKDFDCGVSRGIPCKSLTDINALIDQKRLPPRAQTLDAEWVEAYIPETGHRYVIGK